MKRFTLLFSFVFISVLAFGQSVNYTPEELQKLQFEREQAHVEAIEPSLDRAPFSSTIPPGYTQTGFRSGDIGYAWNIFDNNSGIGEGPVTVDLDNGTLTLIQGVPGATIWMAAGDFADDIWYVVSNEASAGLYTVDPATGDYTLVGYTGLGSVTGLAYDVTTGIMYASQYAAPNSQLYEIDLATGAVTLVGMITDGIIIGIAADNDGNIYGTKLNDNSLYSINSATGAGTLIGELGVAINFAQDIGYDRDNDILYGTMYAATGGFYEINTETGFATLIHNFIAEVAGFGIPYTTAEDDAPGAVTDFTVEPGAMGALEAHLAWTNPAVTFDGEPLTELTSVVVERGGEVIHTIVDPVIGGDVTYTDTTVPEAGLYNYRVYGVNAVGEGPKTSISLYIGEDVPAAPGNVLLFAVGNDGHVTWDAPTEGLNGGYLSGDNLVYTVVRMPEETMVAEDIEATEFLDTTVPGIGNYFYTVTASNHIGVGGTAASNVELLAAEGILMFETFDYPAGQLPPGWVLDGVPHAWAVNNSSIAGGEVPELRLNWSPAAVGLSRLITYPIDVEGYSELRLQFKQMLSNFSAYAGEVMGIDASYDGGETWEVLWNFDVTESIPAGEYEVYLNVPAGKTVMHLAFRFDGDSYNINQWYIDDVTLMPVVEHDLVAQNITGNSTPSEGIETIYTINVQNAGTQTTSDYTVKLMQQGGTVLASVPGVPIEFGETIAFQVPWTPETAGPVTIYGYVDFPADEVPGNNQTPNLNVVVQPGDILAVTIGDGEVLTGLPYNFFWVYSISQTLYYPDEIGLSGGVITGIQYTNNFNATLTNKHIQIWMGETDMPNLAGGWVDPSTLQLVFDGLVNFPEGINDIFIPLDDIYVYGGGNLVIYSNKNDDSWASLRNFYNTLDAGSSRSRNAQNDGTPYDPANPPAGAVNHNHPNITMFFSTAGLGALEGTVTENGEPVEGVNVHIMGTNSNATTNDEGFFAFPYVLPGTYDLHLTKFGYYDAMLEDVVVVEDETTVVTTEIEAFPTVYVMGTVVGSDFPDFGIVGANVTLTGYDNYTAVTGANGIFVIEGVYADNDYDILIQAEGYDSYTAVVEVGTEDVDLGTIIVMEIAFPVSGVVAVETDDGALVTWDSPGTGVLVKLFQHMDEMPANPNGLFQVNTEALGTIFDLSDYPDATVSFLDFHHLDWGIPSDNYEYKVHIVDWANFEILHTVDGLFTENNDDWELDVPLGHFSVAGYEQVGILIQPLGFQPNDAYPVITSDNNVPPNGLSVRAPVNNLAGFTNVGPQIGDFFINLWITTSFGKDRVVQVAPISSGEIVPQETRNEAAVIAASTQFTQVANVVETGERALESFRVYRLLDGEQGDMDDWAELVIHHPDTFYLDTGWEDLAQGLYRYAVIAEYTNENLSAPMFSNILPKDMTVPFTVNVTTNSGDLPTGAMVHLINMDEPIYEYEAVVPPTGIVDFLHIWRGFYAMTIELEGFDTYYVEDIDITEAAEYFAELIESIIPPYALNVTTFGLPLGDALLTWNTAEETEFRYDDGVVDAQLGSTGGTLNTILGAVHHHDAELWEISWWLTSEGGPHNTVKVWVLGLDANGMPDRDNIVYTAENVPNVDNQWNTHVLPNALLLPDGFFIGLSYAGFLGLGTDDGVGAPWEFVPNTQFFCGNITDPGSAFSPIEQFGFFVNYLLRGFGLDFGPIDYGKGGAEMKQVVADGSMKPTVGTPIERPFDTGTPEYISTGKEASRAFLGFNVYLDDELVAPLITETEYYFTGLEDGYYVAGVQSVYTTGESEIVTEGFFIGEIFYDVTFNLDMTGVEGFDPEIHTVYLTGTFTDWAEPGTEGSIEMFLGDAPPQVIFYENFNAGVLPDGWLNLDEDGDGHFWFFVEEPGHLPYDGNYAMASASWEMGTILYPDNWLITHQIENVTENYTLSFQVKAQDPAWPAEKYDVLISTTGNDPADFTSIHSEVLSSGVWQERTLELGEFAGEDIYIAFRHWDSSDWFQIVIDAIKVEGTPAGKDAGLFYTVTVPIAEGFHEYKYFSDAFGEGWDGGEWDGDPNRELVVVGDMEVNDVWGIIFPVDPEPIVTLPYFEDFTGLANGELPEFWERTHTNWGAWNSNNAGGESAPELRFNWSPSAISVFRAITPLVDGKNAAAIDLSFWHMVNDYSGDYTLKVQTSLDGVTWTTQWEHYVAAAKDVPASRDIISERIPSTYMTIPLEGVAGEEFHLAFVFDGDSWNINQWYIDDILVEESIFMADLPFEEDFSGLANGEMPEHWDRTHTNWGAWNTNNAGGEAAPELRFNWTPSATAVFRAITPRIKSGDAEAVALGFWHMVNDYSGDYTLKVQTTIDGGATWTTQWEHYIAAAKDVPTNRDVVSERNIPSTYMTIPLEGVVGHNFHVAFVFDGNSFNINQWYIDDVFVYEDDEIPTYTVTFNVVNVYGQPIEDAIITLGGVEHEPGVYVFEDVEEGWHEYSVHAFCYLPEVGEMWVDGDMEHEIILGHVPGDATGDGVVNILDVIAVSGFWGSGTTPTNWCFVNADINGDGIINVLDIIGITNIFAGGKVAPYGDLKSETGQIFMGTQGIVLESDGTLAGIEFAFTGNVAGLELNLELPNHEMIVVHEDGSVRVMIFSFDNTPIPAGTTELVSFSHNASAEWVYVLAGNLNADEVPVVTNDYATGIDEVSDVSFIAYPNPASDVIYVDLTGVSKANISLINVHGQLVEVQPVDGNQQVRFNIGNLPSGIYMLRLDYNNSFIIERIMVK